MDPIALVETAYAPAADEGAWLEATTRAARAVFGNAEGVFSLAYEATDPEWVAIRGVSALGLDPAFARAFVNGPPIARGEETRAMVRIFRTVLVTSARRKLEESPPILRGYFEKVLAGAGVADAAVVNATDPSRLGIMFVAPAGSRRRWSPREAHRWQRIAAHVAAG